MQQLNEAVDKAIEEVILPLANKGHEYYLGASSQIIKRIRSHVHESGCKDYQQLFLAKDVHEAMAFESTMVTKCAVNKNINVRRLIRNAKGGGQIHGFQMRLDCSYTVYAMFDSKKTSKPGAIESASFYIGNLLHDDLNAMSSILIKKFLLPIVQKKILIKVGYTMEKNLSARMYTYNYDENFNFVATSNAHNFVLTSTGSIFNKRTLNNHDLRLLEMLLIFEIQYGRFSEYSPYIMNICMGGDGGVGKNIRDKNEMAKI